MQRRPPPSRQRRPPPQPTTSSPYDIYNTTVANRQRALYPPAASHRAGHSAGIHPEDAPYMTGTLIDADAIPDDPPRPHTSIRTYQTTQGQQVIEKGNQRMVIHQGKPKGRYPLFLWILIGMIIALGIVYAWNLVGTWWAQHQLDAAYGYPRTYQTDAIVYPGDSAAHPSHYIFLNLNGTVEIIELPHGDSADARIYKGPTLVMDNADQVPITGEFRQVNGKEEMIVHIGDQELVYINNGQKFVPQP